MREPEDDEQYEWLDALADPPEEQEDWDIAPVRVVLTRLAQGDS